MNNSMRTLLPVNNFELMQLPVAAADDDECSFEGLENTRV